MGNSAAYMQQPTVQQQFTIVSVDEQLGSTLLLQKHSGEEYCMKEFTSNSEQELRIFQKQIKHKKAHTHSNVLAVVYDNVVLQTGTCARSYKYHIISEYPFHTLYDDIRDRRRSRQWFSQGQILSILYSCAVGLKHLYDLGCIHESLCSNNIYIHRNGLIKIADPHLLRHPDNLSRLSSHSNKEHIYLSPQQLKSTLGSHHKTYSPQMSDVFTLGMIILEVIHLEWMDDIYDSTSVCTAGLTNLIAQINTNYGPSIRMLLEGMLEIDAKVRVTLKQIESYIEGLDVPNVANESVSSTHKPLSKFAEPTQQKLTSTNQTNLRLHSQALRSPTSISSNHIKLDSETATLCPSHNKLELLSRYPIQNYKHSTRCSQASPKQELMPIPANQKNALNNISSKLVNRTIVRLDSGVTFAQSKSKHGRGRSRSDKSDKQKIHIYKKHTANNELQTGAANDWGPTFSAHETPNKIYQQFYPYTQFVKQPTQQFKQQQLENVSGQKVDNRFRILQNNEVQPKSQASKCTHLESSSFSQKTVCRMKNSASIHNSPQPVILLKRFDTSLTSNNIRKEFQSANQEQKKLESSRQLAFQSTTKKALKTPELLNQKEDYDKEPSSSNNRQNLITELRSRLHATSQVCLKSPKKLQNDLIEPETLDNSDKIIESQLPSKKTITFGIDSSGMRGITIMNEDTFDDSHSIAPKEEVINAPDQHPPNNRSMHQKREGNDSLTKLELDLQVGAFETAKPKVFGENREPEYVNEVSKNGGRYEGFKVNGLREGFGRFYYADGGYYEGRWSKNKMEGFGKLFYQNEQHAYEGYWSDDMFNGIGKLWNDCPQATQEPFDFNDFSKLGNRWLHYNGAFCEDIRTGLGALSLTNGEFFQGQFKDDQVNGHGKYYSLNGVMHQGVWKNGKFVSQIG